MGQTVEKGIAREEVFKAFLVEEKARGRTEQGMTGVRIRVPHLFRYLDEQCISYLSVGIKEATSYQGWLLERKTKEGKTYAAKTVVSYYTAAVCFYEYLKRHNMIPGNPFKSVRRVRPEKSIPRDLLTEEETDKLFASLSVGKRRRIYASL